jgi:hypothetical protein
MTTTTAIDPRARWLPRARDHRRRDRRLVRKARPRVQLRNPVMFVVYVGSVLTTAIGIAALLGRAPHAGGPAFVLGISAWLWLTVLFANFAEAVAEGRGKAQAATLRAMRRDVHAKKLLGKLRTRYHMVEAGALRSGASSAGPGELAPQCPRHGAHRDLSARRQGDRSRPPSRGRARRRDPSDSARVSRARVFGSAQR